MISINRRRVLLAATSAVAAVNCDRQRDFGERSRVAVLKHVAYDSGLYETVRKALVQALTPGSLRGKRVLLKPNLVEFDPGSAVNTHPLFVHAALEACLSLGAARVAIAEGPGHRRNAWDLADEAGYFRTVAGFERLFTDLNLDRTRAVPFAGPLQSLHLPVTALDTDVLVSLPKMKTHHWVGATLSMKNLFGLVPGGIYGWPKNVLHWAGIPECIAGLYRLFPRTIAIVDGVTGMEGNGPIQGLAKRAGVIVAGDNLAAVDATCCRIMGIDPHRLSYLNLADANRIAEEAIIQTAEAPRALRTDFALLPEFQSLRLPQQP
jgi:uncharacterized protein (DUF362 family)